MDNQEKESKLGVARTVLKFVVTGVVELFTGAVCASVLGQVGGGKIPKFGARVGGALVGLMVGDQVGDYICDEIDEFMEDLDEFKEAVEEE